MTSANNFTVGKSPVKYSVAHRESILLGHAGLKELKFHIPSVELLLETCIPEAGYRIP
jgi:hypothetical protein